MRRFGVLAFVAGLLVSFATAQSTTLSAVQSYQPTPTWTVPNGACTAGSTAAGGGPYGSFGATGGGVYEDIYGDFWEMEWYVVISGRLLDARVRADLLCAQRCGVEWDDLLRWSLPRHQRWRSEPHTGLS
jgi:hypothetical protein